MHELLEYLIDEMNASKGVTYIIKHEGVKGDWYLKDVDFPNEDDAPLHITWSKLTSEALAFKSIEKVKDFAMECVVPRPCSIIKISEI